jgi:hypothetical protein
VLPSLPSVECMELLLDKLGKTRSNLDFLVALSG